MFTNTKAGYVRDGKVLTESVCLSTDTKPTTGIANGSCLIEMDTGDRFMFDEAGSQWLNITNPGGGGDEPEVWFASNEYEDQDGQRWFVLTNVGSAEHRAELYNNGANYQVFVNGVELPYYFPDHHQWQDNEDELSATLLFTCLTSEVLGVIYTDPSTAPTSVEVSVKAK